MAVGAGCEQRQQRQQRHDRHILEQQDREGALRSSRIFSAMAVADIASANPPMRAPRQPVSPSA
jgi:hypothetical protein